MRLNTLLHPGLWAGAPLKTLPALAAAGLFLLGLGPTTSRAEQVLLNAPSANYAYYGMWSPYATAASFTLASSDYISTIDVVLRTPASTTFNTFHFSLQDTLGYPANVFAAQDLTAALGTTSTEVMNVNATLPAGTYYLAGIVPGYAGTPPTPGDVDGWLVSTGAYSGAAGSIANGVWTGSMPPVFHTGGVYLAPAFTVNGSPVPEPATWALFTAGTVALLARRHRHRFQMHGTLN